MPGYPQILEAVKRVRTKVRWKPNSAENYLRKRKMRGHLPQEATIKDYEGIILKLLQDKSAVVYLYWYKGVPYVTVTVQGFNLSIGWSCFPTMVSWKAAL